MIRALTNTVGWMVSFVFGAVTALILVCAVLAGHSAYLQNQTSLAGELAPAAEQNEPRTLSRWWRAKNDLNEQFSTTHLTSRRALDLRTFVPYDALFDEGEVRPDPAFADLYATARAPRVLMRFCEELLLSMARRCQLAGFDGKVDADGQVDMRARFHFLPDAAPGDLPKLADGEIQSFFIHLTGVNRIPDTPDMRQHALAGAEQLCEALRASLQNCVVSRVYFSPDVRRGSGSRLLEARVVLAAYTDLSEADQQEVLASLRAQAKSVFP